MKVWISKYALTQGIFTLDVELCTGISEHMVSTTKGACYHKGDWHTTREDAIAAAEQMRVKKIAGLKKQIVKLEKMTFAEDAK